MNKISGFAVAMAAIVMMMTACGPGNSGNVSLKTDVDSAFYAFGVLQGKDIRNYLKPLPGADSIIHTDAYLAGFRMSLEDKVAQLKMTPEEAQTFLQTYITVAQTKDAEKAKTTEDAFFASNKSKPGVITTESGLQYKVITEGKGAKPTIDNVVVVHYTGKLLDGTVFDSSVDRGEPATFPVSGVIRGWTEVLQLMPVGSKYQVWIPYSLAYDAQPPQGSAIKPYSTLDFEVELLDIQPQTPAQ
ncbi:MAG: FKBP-type peptidyl-prolyl cis-trans isomerase [Tannerella sp.]|jgi:FKBP-type peptidyl-prolyl cis-trans isomerase|nr:FKBP-type peptidyl-prolyl cis-trans isomerase [Tannerella sp.]